MARKIIFALLCFGLIAQAQVSRGNSVSITPTITDAGTGAANAPAIPVSITHNSTGTPIAATTGTEGFKVGYQWNMKNGAGSIVPTLTMETLWRDASESFGSAAVILSAIDTGVVETLAVWDNYKTNYGIGSDVFNMATSTGTKNVALGQFTLADMTSAQGNAAIGETALRRATTAVNNVAIGRSALVNLTTSLGSVGVGSGSCAAVVSGDSNVCIGASANILDTLANGAETNEIVIGANATGAGSNTAVIGDGAITDVYFGSATPAAKIHAGGGSAGKAVCWKADGKTLGFCSDAVGVSGGCTCN